MNLCPLASSLLLPFLLVLLISSPTSPYSSSHTFIKHLSSSLKNNAISSSSFSSSSQGHKASTITTSATIGASPARKRSTFLSPSSAIVRARATTVVALSARQVPKWEDLSITDEAEDTAFKWYIIQCVAGTENTTVTMLKKFLPKFPGAEEAIQSFTVS
jgi:hypothetical protein